MSVFQSLTLMIAFSCLVIQIINKKINNQKRSPFRLLLLYAIPFS